jgi:hypothetical protein
MYNVNPERIRVSTKESGGGGWQFFFGDDYRRNLGEGCAEFEVTMMKIGIRY